MKGINGRLLKKTKSIPNVPYLKHQECILHVHASIPSPSPSCDPSRILRNLPFSGEVEPVAKYSDNILSPTDIPARTEEEEEGSNK
ncbi:hypothetical protein Cni_G08534 [Canna indica]|uniref:Uncharacterized protein n=1 Tax=Canna indica TaxID=4628 RepID=A0AAQ3K0X6_9LILI|nr:hypothetical protein Cni_G08534 [Canna indica]